MNLSTRDPLEVSINAMMADRVVAALSNEDPDPLALREGETLLGSILGGSALLSAHRHGVRGSARGVAYLRPAYLASGRLARPNANSGTRNDYFLGLKEAIGRIRRGEIDRSAGIEARRFFAALARILSEEADSASYPKGPRLRTR